MQTASIIKHQLMLALRKDGLPQADEYCEGRRELLSVLMKKFIVARLE